jgi:predicted transcriptional regulator
MPDESTYGCFDGFVDRLPEEFVIAKPCASRPRPRVNTNEKFIDIVKLVHNPQPSADRLVYRVNIDTDTATPMLLHFIGGSKPPCITIGETVVMIDEDGSDADTLQNAQQVIGHTEILRPHIDLHGE